MSILPIATWTAGHPWSWEPAANTHSETLPEISHVGERVRGLGFSQDGNSRLDHHKQPSNRS